MPLAPVTKIILCLLRNARRARASWESGKCRPELLSNHIHPRQAGLEAFLLAVLEKAVGRGDSSMGRRWVHPGRFGYTKTTGEVAGTQGSGETSGSGGPVYAA